MIVIRSTVRAFAITGLTFDKITVTKTANTPANKNIIPTSAENI